MPPTISIIIPSLNSPLIGHVVAAILNQDTASLQRVGEILIIGKDRGARIPRHPLVRFVDTGHPVNAAVARNLGIVYAGGERLVFLDADCMPQIGWLSAHIAAHEAGQQVVGGSVMPDSDSYWGLVYNLTLFHEFLSSAAPGRRQLLPTLNLGVAREAVAAAGLLDERLRRGQDMEWTVRMRRAGIPLTFRPDAVIDHQHNRTTLRLVWRDCARSGYFSRRIRLEHAGSMGPTRVLRYRAVVLLLAPLIALAVTTRIVLRQWRLFSRPRFALTVPGIYLTKLAWAWGASRRREPGEARAR